MGKTIEVLSLVLGVGLIASGAHELLASDENGMNLAQKISIAYDTPEVIQYAKAALSAKAETVLGSLGILYFLTKNKM